MKLGSQQFVLQVDEIEVVMPNQHYFTIDMTKMGLQNKDEVSGAVEEFKLKCQHRQPYWHLFPCRYFSPWTAHRATSQAQCAGSSEPSCEEAITALIFHKRFTRKHLLNV